MLISVHMPKTAGTSFEHSLRQHFGERLELRYADKPLHQHPLRRNLRAAREGLRGQHGPKAAGAAGCVHGHFLPLSYRHLVRRADVRFVTWLREPIDRLLSHYHYWRRSAGNDVRDPVLGPSQDPLQDSSQDKVQRRMREENWSFEQFARRRELRNVYRAFLWGFPVERFDFIGITEHYASDLREFGRRFLDRELRPADENRNPEHRAGAAGDGYAIDRGLRDELERLHARDVALYRFALERRERRLANRY